MAPLGSEDTTRQHRAPTEVYWALGMASSEAASMALLDASSEPGHSHLGSHILRTSQGHGCAPAA